MRNFVVLIFMIFGLIGCMANPRSSVAKATSKVKSISSSGIGGSPATDTTTTTTTTTSSATSVEIKQFIDPFDGTFKKKLTLPKNYKGYFYITGLNITSLQDKFVKAKFSFGREYEPVILPVTISRIPEQGLTSLSDLEVAVIDMSNKPFANLRLSYDLYDYKMLKSGVTSGSGAFSSDPRDGDLYCRGLNFIDDSTATTSTCSSSTDQCLYSYAKVVDSGLYNSSNIALSPTNPQVAINGSGAGVWTNDTTSQHLSKCLPDNVNSTGTGTGSSLTDFMTLFANTNAFFGTSQSYSASPPYSFSIGGSSYYYSGPYRKINEEEWNISGQATIGSGGLFMNETAVSNIVSSSGTGSGSYYFNSLLFPRRTDLSIQSSTHYFKEGALAKSGISQTIGSGMDGCNARMTSYNQYTGETIGSCNVTAKIQLIVVDTTTSAETVLAEATNLKLQLIRASATNYEGKEVLYSSMRVCSSSSACGSGDCCFNNRCWSKDLVGGSCIEDITAIGNLTTGLSCTSDYQCSSLCCNSGKCAVHKTTTSSSETPVFCSKTSGESCISEEFCAKESVQKCFVVKNTANQTKCSLQCYHVSLHGQCSNGTCTPASVPSVPYFDAAVPECSNYSDAKTYAELVASGLIKSN